MTSRRVVATNHRVDVPKIEEGEERSMKKLLRRLRAEDRGAATAEYAIATLAAVGFAGLLVAILRSDAVRAMLLDLVTRALSFGG